MGINVNLDEIVNAMNSLQQLQNTCNDKIFVPKEALGGGLTAAQLEILEEMYANLFSSFSELVGKTILMFRGTATAITNADRKAAQAFELSE